VSAFVIAAFLFTQPAFAQTGFARSDQLQSLGEDLAGIASRVQVSVDNSMSSMSNLRNSSGDEVLNQTTAILDTIEAETRSVIETIKPTSAFMSALDSARGDVLVLLRREERDPPSPTRDSRIARLTNSLALIDEQHAEILAAESVLNSMIGEQLRVRDELRREGGVIAVERLVTDLTGLTTELSEMSRVLSEISAAALRVSSADLSSN
jgi:hypothetical protein